jgi:WhiB family transcriptional regulator, redox-sensing transcriptional regulator
MTRRNEVTADSLEWQQHGLCSDPGWAIKADWYADDRDKDGQAEAKAICSICPAKQACLDYAIVFKEEYGIWGGYNRKERDNYVRRMQRKNAA